MIYEDPIVVSIAEIATGEAKTLTDVLSGDLILQNLTFHNMHRHDLDNIAQLWEAHSYGGINVTGSRFFGYFGIRVDSFNGKAIFTKNNQERMCDVVGLVQHAKGYNDGNWNRIWIWQDDWRLIKPFKRFRLVSFDEYLRKNRQMSFILHLDPECSGLNQRQLELFTLASRSSSLQVAVKDLIIAFMKKFWILYVIEPHRVAWEEPSKKDATDEPLIIPDNEIIPDTELEIIDDHTSPPN